LQFRRPVSANALLKRQWLLCCLIQLHVI